MDLAGSSTAGTGFLQFSSAIFRPNSSSPVPEMVRKTHPVSSLYPPEAAPDPFSVLIHYASSPLSLPTAFAPVFVTAAQKIFSARHPGSCHAGPHRPGSTALRHIILSQDLPPALRLATFCRPNALPNIENRLSSPASPQPRPSATRLTSSPPEPTPSGNTENAIWPRPCFSRCLGLRPQKARSPPSPTAAVSSPPFSYVRKQGPRHYQCKVLASRR